jgi:hypothetical protein
MSHGLTTYKQPSVMTLITEAPTIPMLFSLLAAVAKSAASADTKNKWASLAEIRYAELEKNPPRFERVSLEETGMNAVLQDGDVEKMDQNIQRFQRKFLAALSEQKIDL